MATDLPAWADPDTITAHRANPRPWRHRAACRDMNPTDAAAAFFPVNLEGRGGTNVDRRMRDTVASWCAICPVNTACVAEHLYDDDGVFGTTPRQRRRLRQALAARGVAVARPRSDPRLLQPRSDDAQRQARARAARARAAR